MAATEGAKTFNFVDTFWLGFIGFNVCLSLYRYRQKKKQGGKLELTCTQCGTKVSKDANFCRKCGSKVVAEAQATLEQLQCKKRVLTSYGLFVLGGFGILGVHHMYLNRFVHGILALCTLNFCGLGALLDLLLIPRYVSRFNAERTAAMAPYDDSRRKLFWVLPRTLLICAVIAYAAAFHVPKALMWYGAMPSRFPWESEAKDPYQVLGLRRGASTRDAKAAYRDLSKRWHPDKNPGCGKECDEKMSDITKAYDDFKRFYGDGSSTSGPNADTPAILVRPGPIRDWAIVLYTLAQMGAQMSQNTG